MLKKLYLKHFIFFLPLLTYNFYSYGGDFDDNLSEAQRYQMWRHGFNGNNGFNSRKMAEIPILKVIQGSVKQGAAQALTKEALRVLSRVLEIVPYSVNKFIAMIKIYAYKISFGTTGLSVRDLTKFSNRIHSLCSPLASSQIGNMRKTKRANTIEGEQANGQSVDTVWMKRRTDLITELEHVITFLKSQLPCYNAAFQSIDASAFERQMASIIYALSTENNNEIQSYIIRLVGYIKDLINLLESFSSFDNAVEHSDETKILLNFIRLTFEHISSFLTDGNVKSASGFQKMADDGGGNKRDLMDILGSGGLK